MSNRLFGTAYRRLTAEEIRDSLLHLTGELSTEQAAATALTYGEDLDDPMKLRKDHASQHLPARGSQQPSSGNGDLRCRPIPR